MKKRSPLAARAQVFNVSSTGFPQVAGRVSICGKLLLGAALAIAPGVAFAQATDPFGTFRIFLHDGYALPSYGEFTQLGERVVFVLPVGDLQAKPELQLVSVPTSAIDMARTIQ